MGRGRVGSSHIHKYLYIDTGCEFTASQQYLFFLFIDF